MITRIRPIRNNNQPIVITEEPTIAKEKPLVPMSNRCISQGEQTACTQRDLCIQTQLVVPKPQLSIPDGLLVSIEQLLDKYCFVVVFEFEDFVSKLDRLADFYRSNEIVLFDKYGFIDERLEFSIATPWLIIQSLSIQDRLRLFTMDFRKDETYNFRLLVFIIYDRALNFDDMFVVCSEHRRNETTILKRVVELRLNTNTLVSLAKYLNEDPQKFVLKCQTYWNLSRNVQEERTTIFH
jgi:hypothetical protein